MKTLLLTALLVLPASAFAQTTTTAPITGAELRVWPSSVLDPTTAPLAASILTRSISFTPTGAECQKTKIVLRACLMFQRMCSLRGSYD